MYYWLLLQLCQKTVFDSAQVYWRRYMALVGSGYANTIQSPAAVWVRYVTASSSSSVQFWDDQVYDSDRWVWKSYHDRMYCHHRYTGYTHPSQRRYPNFWPMRLFRIVMSYIRISDLSHDLSIICSHRVVVE